MKEEFRIAIIGGGIGGLFTALSIRHHCPSENLQIDVYEQASQYTEIGAGVGIGPNAGLVIEKIGLLDETLKIAGKRDGVWFSFRRYDSGEEFLMVPAAQKGKQLPMHRAEFLDVLVQSIRRRKAATLHTRKKCQELKDLGHAMSVTFTDGTQTSADLVIGADGIHSSVRSHYLDDDPKYAEMVVYRGLCDMAKLPDTWPPNTYSTLWMAPGKHLLTFPISNNKTLNIVGFVTTPWEELGDVQESWTLKCESSEVQEKYKDFSPAVQGLLENMDANPLKWILYDRDPHKQWIFSNGKVALLGDAAHSMCPHQGAGAGQALEDGYILGRALQGYFRSLNTDHPVGVAQSLQLYESVRGARALKVQTTSRLAGKLYQMQADEVAGLSYEEGLPIMKDILKDRMSWIWVDNLDQEFEQAQKRMFVQQEGRL